MADIISPAEKNNRDNNAQKPWEGVSQQITADSLKDFVVSNFSKIDGNNNSRLSKSEIEQALFTGNKFPGTWTETEMKMLSKLRDNYSALSKMTARSGGGEGFSFFSQITPRDVMAFSDLYKQLSTEQDAITKATKYAKDNFSKLDKDGNGFLSMPELWSSGEATRPEIATLMRHAHKIKGASNDEWGFERKGLSMKDLENYPSKWRDERDHLAEGGFCGCAMCRAVSGRPTKGGVLDIIDK